MIWHLSGDIFVADNNKIYTSIEILLIIVMGLCWLGDALRDGADF